FDTRYETMVEAALGGFEPTGRLPITFPCDASAIAVDDRGVCASPNDVPGFAKEQHMGGRPYVYVDADGSRYQLGHGLGWTRDGAGTGPRALPRASPAYACRSNKVARPWWPALGPRLMRRRARAASDGPRRRGGSTAQHTTKAPSPARLCR